MNFGIRLKELRMKRGLTQLQMAEILETSKSNISKYEAGSVEPSLETLLKISKFFNVSIDFLMGISDTDILQSVKSSNDYGSQYFFFFFDDVLKDIFTMRLSKELEKNKLSAKEFAIACSIDIDTCEAYLSGEQEPSLEDLLSISRALNISVDYLLGQIDERFEGFLCAFKHLSVDNKDIIIGETKKLLKEQRYENSVAADSSLKEAK